MSLCNPVFARLSDGALNFHSKYAVTKKNIPAGYKILENDMDYKEEKMAVKQTAGRDALGEFAPNFAQLNDDVLFGEV